MATVVESTIGSGGDYATLAAWIAACPADLVAADQVWKGKVIGTLTETLTVPNTITTDATRYVWVTGNEPFNAHANKLTNPLRYNNAVGSAIVCPGDYVAAINTSSPHMRVSDLQIRAAGGDSRKAITGDALLHLENCIVYGSGSLTATLRMFGSNGAVRMRNCLLIAVSGAAAVYAETGSPIPFEGYNCTLIRLGTPGNYAFRLEYATGVAVLKNCAVFGFTALEYAAGSFSAANSGYNATDLASIAGSNNQVSLTFADQFEDITNGTEDFRAKETGSLDLNGTRDATNTADLDIVGQARSTLTPTIGAWEVVTASGPTLTIPTGTATGTTTATVGATTDTATGTLYGFVSTSATPPSAANLKAGTGAVWSGSVAVSSTGAKTLSATGLTAGTNYYAHLLHNDGSKDSNIVTSAQFTTTSLTKKLKLLAHADAQGDSGVAGVVFAAPAGSDITGAKIGEFTGKTFEASLEGGKAVLKVPVADFGGSALTTSDTPVALVRNATNTTGIISCTVIEE